MPHASTKLLSRRVSLLRAYALELALASLLAIQGACATPKTAVPTGDAEPKLLREEQALLAIQEALMRAGTLAERSYPLTLEGESFEADVHFGDPPYAIEWVGLDDRRALGDRLPRGAPNGPLQIANALGVDGPVQVLVLDAQAYPYEGNPLLVQRGAAGIDEAERKLRQDIDDFLEYVRDQAERP